MRGSSEIQFTFTITIPLWLVWIIIQPVLLYRRLRCGYAFSRIPLTQGQFAIVDPDDFLQLCKRRWFAVRGGSTFYAVHSVAPKQGKRYRLYMHREVLKVPEDMFVDHINCNGLDNRKANLRLATRAQNQRNRKKCHSNSRSRYKGLHWDRHWKKWRVRICINRTKIQLGLFDDEIEAANAYDRAAKEYHGQFASLNFPDGTADERGSTLSLRGPQGRGNLQTRIFISLPRSNLKGHEKIVN